MVHITKVWELIWKLFSDIVREVSFRQKFQTKGESNTHMFMGQTNHIILRNLNLNGMVQKAESELFSFNLTYYCGGCLFATEG